MIWHSCTSASATSSVKPEAIYPLYGSFVYICIYIYVHIFIYIYLPTSLYVFVHTCTFCLREGMWSVRHLKDLLGLPRASWGVIWSKVYITVLVSVDTPPSEYWWVYILYYYGDTSNINHTVCWEDDSGAWVGLWSDHESRPKIHTSADCGFGCFWSIVQQGG